MEKYKKFGLLVLTLLFALPAAAQLGEERHNFAVGINGGLNMSSVSFNPKIKLNTLNTMSMGVTMRYMSEKYFKMMCGVQMEINYSQRGWDEKIEDDSGNSYSRTMNYLEIPFMAHLAFGKDALNRGVKVFFNAGPQIGFFLGDNEKINWTTSTTVKNRKFAWLEIHHTIPFGRVIAFCQGNNTIIRPVAIRPINLSTTCQLRGQQFAIHLSRCLNRILRQLEIGFFFLCRKRMPFLLHFI